MRITNDNNRQLAMGPYLSAGIFISALFGTQFIDWYLSLFI
jgi:prepilin signal peptidase PulO-like enzyme (type II secretory pathway)